MLSSLHCFCNRIQARLNRNELIVNLCRSLALMDVLVRRFGQNLNPITWPWIIPMTGCLRSGAWRRALRCFFNWMRSGPWAFAADLSCMRERNDRNFWLTSQFISAFIVTCSVQSTKKEKSLASIMFLFSQQREGNPAISHYRCGSCRNAWN